MLAKTKVCISNIIYEGERKFKAKVKNVKGMEMLQMILIVGIAVVLAGLIMVFFKTYFANDDTGFWGIFKDKISNIFNAGNDYFEPTT